MKNLINKKVKVNPFLTYDPFNKSGEIGTVIKVNIIDEENADVTILFNDGNIGNYQYGTFDIVD